MAVSSHLITDNRNSWSEHEDNQANCHIDARERLNNGERDRSSRTDE
jgi:hypothetical protein